VQVLIDGHMWRHVKARVDGRGNREGTKPNPRGLLRKGRPVAGRVRAGSRQREGMVVGRTITGARRVVGKPIAVGDGHARELEEQRHGVRLRSGHREQWHTTLPCRCAWRILGNLDLDLDLYDGEGSSTGRGLRFGGGVGRPAEGSGSVLYDAHAETELW